MRYICFFLLAFLALPLSAQQQDISIATVNGKPVYLSEFETAYKKNSLDNSTDKKNLEDFLDKYIDFKLNVEEAYTQKLDTNENYRYQYDVFRSSLVQPYLDESAFHDEYIAMLYNRMTEDVDINHAFVPFDTESNIVFAADTLKAYKKAMELRQQLLKNGFKGNAYRDYTLMPDLVPDFNKANGHIGWITPFMFNLQTINVAYSIPVGEISMPVRAADGYHIIQVLGKRPAIGTRTIEQVVFMYPSIPPTKHQVDSVTRVVRELKKSINTDADFRELCRAYTEAYGLGENGCSFEAVTLDSKLPPNFIHAVFDLKKDGEISLPVTTMFGVHIIQLKGSQPIQPLAEMKEKLYTQISKSDYAYYLATEFQHYLFRKYHLELNEQAYQKLAEVAGKINPETTDFSIKITNRNDILFAIDDTIRYTVGQFMTYMEEQQLIDNSNEKFQLEQLFGQSSKNPYNFTTDRLQYHIDQFAARQLHGYVTATMDERQPDVRWKLQEFSDGLLAYAVKEKNIWSKNEVLDSELESFYNKHKSKYHWATPHYKGYIVRSVDRETKAEVDNLLKTAKYGGDIRQLLQSAFGENWKDKIFISKGVWEKGANAYVDKAIFKMPTTIAPNNKYPEYTVFGKLLKNPELFEDVRGEVEADYLEKREADWNKSLREKYTVEIDQASIKKYLK
ncbi:peptidylprolyl isomerase [Dysgonomonas sp. 25]|uniref:peptidylprolyl isomerase n=1 Tax=Dysgonomonas sp. 25 TaxID=2302933 RepID=UPI0013D0D074|nr:peptidylprolyl isomerase [Dysgonomonas sp. 25]NDV68960.1 hypothetical protein [Dysgonomonas sp. 25]